MTSAFSDLGFHIPLTSFALFAVLILVISVWIVFSLIIRYHWKNYGTSKLEVLTMNMYYFGGSGVLIALSVLFAFLYHTSSAT